MKIFNLKRGGGKTTRLIYASELHNAPIICMNQLDRNYIIRQAREYGVNIPEPITVQEFVNTKRGTGVDKVLVDESMYVMENMLSCVMGRKIEILAATLTTDELERGTYGNC